MPYNEIVCIEMPDAFPAVEHAPRGALPAGISLSDIAITDVSDDPSIITVGGPEGFTAILLEPSGTVFASPVVLTAALAAPAGATIVAASISG